MSRCIIYTRVSSDDQKKNGVSLPAQEAKCRAYCAMHGMEIVGHHHDDGISAKNTSGRPALKDALLRLERKDADALLFVKLDRAVRSVRDTQDLVDLSEKQGWKLHSIDERLDTGSAIGRFIINVIASLGQMERELVGERTKSALSHLKATGKRYCRHPPYGWKHEGGKLVKDENESFLIEKANDALRRDGDFYREVAFLNSTGHVTRLGDPWSIKLLKAAHKSWQRQLASAKAPAG